MRRALAGLVLLLLLLLGRWWLMREPPRATQDPPASPTARSSAATSAATSARPEASARAQRLRDGAAARAAKHRLIREAIAAREAAPPRPSSAADEPPAARPATKRPPAAPTDEVPAIPPLLDRTGNYPYLTRVLSQDLLPLVDECEALAREKHPDLAGLLNLNVEILGDEDIGGVIDSLEPAADNEIADPDLLECVRESLLATTLPPPDQGGRDAVVLSLRIGPEPTRTPDHKE